MLSMPAASYDLSRTVLLVIMKPYLLPVTVWSVQHTHTHVTVWNGHAKPLQWTCDAGLFKQSLDMSADLTDIIME